MTTPRIAIVIEGGLVQAIVSDTSFPLEIAVIDYDVEDNDFNTVYNSDGSTSEAYISKHVLTIADIDMNKLFE